MKSTYIITILICLVHMSSYAQDSAIEEKIKRENCTTTSYGSYSENPRVEYRSDLDIYVLYLDGFKDVETRVGIFDNKGTCIVSPLYSAYGFTSNSDLRIFKYHGSDKIVGYKEVAKRVNKKNPYQYGLIDNNGREILPCKYSSIHLSPIIPIAIVVEGETYKYEQDHGFREDLVKNGKWGLFDMENKKWLIPCKYEYIGGPDFGSYSAGCLVEKGAYTSSAERLKNYAYLSYNVGGNRKEEFEDPIGGLWGMFDIYGNEVIPSKYNKIKKLKDGNVQVTYGKKGEISILNPLGGKPFVAEASTGKLNKVDKNIPVSNSNNNAETFAFIIGNERYNYFNSADYAINDAKIMAEYCKSTLGMPSENVSVYEDLTYGNFIGMLQKIKDISDAYDGDARIIFYFSGNGLKDVSGNRYLLTSDANDGYLDKTAISLSSVRKVLDELNCKMALCLIDAPFNGNDKSGKPLTKDRGIAISSSKEICNNIVMALSGDDSRSSEEYSHGLFTYYLLENLQKYKGKVQLGQFLNDAATNSGKTAIGMGLTPPKPEIINLSESNSKISLR